MARKELKYSFQTDSDIVRQYREEDANYVVEIDENSPNKDLCVIYFTSNALYYPNTEKSFRRSIIERNYYEWRQSVPISAHRQIFVRDLYKQWYLQGINSQINTPPGLLGLLKCETHGYKTITVGSSAGGYAAILYGSLLGAERIFAFNPQFEINSLLNTSNEGTNPLLFRHIKNPDLRQYYDIVPIIGKSQIFYFVSEKSEWDNSQMKHLGNSPNVSIIRFKSAHHGVPFPRVTLTSVMSAPDSRLLQLNGKSFSPIIFSIKFVGIRKTFVGLLSQGMSVIRKHFSNGK